MNTAPGGDAMTIRYHRDAAAAALKREVARRPISWRIHPDNVVRFAAEGKRCEIWAGQPPGHDRHVALLAIG